MHAGIVQPSSGRFKEINVGWIENCIMEVEDEMQLDGFAHRLVLYGEEYSLSEVQCGVLKVSFLCVASIYGCKSEIVFLDFFVAVKKTRVFQQTN
jgi:hypothetical protein